MKLIETITNTTITLILSALSGLFGILLGAIYSEVVPIILPTLTQKLPITVLLRIFVVVLILLALSIALSIFIYLKYRPKYKARFGALWDGNKEPYCPSCKTYLSGYTENPPDGYYFWCHTHKDYVFIHNNGVPIPLLEAQKLLKP